MAAVWALGRYLDYLQSGDDWLPIVFVLLVTVLPEGCIGRGEIQIRST